MKNETASLTIRRDYLASELAVWSARQDRARQFESMRAFYFDPALNVELGKMRGELERIKHELGEAHDNTIATRKNRRRPKAN